MSEELVTLACSRNICSMLGTYTHHNAFVVTCSQDTERTNGVTQADAQACSTYISKCIFTYCIHFIMYVLILSVIEGGVRGFV